LPVATCPGYDNKGNEDFDQNPYENDEKKMTYCPDEEYPSQFDEKEGDHDKEKTLT
jgi:hypothetical protein